jgi:hypothetical protein
MASSQQSRQQHPCNPKLKEQQSRLHGQSNSEGTPDFNQRY